MKTFLHVGCGFIKREHTTLGFSTDEWKELRLDIDPAVHPDIVASMTDMKSVSDASVDAVYTSHTIEHLYWYQLPLAVKEFYRVLKPTGFLVVTCPDLQSICALVARGELHEICYTAPAGPVAPFDVLFGLRSAITPENTFMAHHSGFTQKSLVDLLRSCGFVTVASHRRPGPYFDLFALASKEAMEKAAIKQLARQHFRF